MAARVLHVLASDDEGRLSIARSLLAGEGQDSPSTDDNSRITIDLSDGEPDYDQLLEAVFAADSIVVW